MNKNILFKGLVALNTIVFTAATAGAANYTVQPKETLSEIAHRKIPGPVWGKSGSLNRLLSMNADISNPNYIYVGEEIETPGQTRMTQITDVPESLVRGPASDTSDQASSSTNTTSASKKTGEFEEHSAITVAPLFSFSRINATDRANGAHSTLGSQMNFGAALGWKQYWSPEFQTALIMSGASNSYSTTSGLTLDHSGFFLGSVELEGRYGALLSPQFIAHVGAIQTPFVRGESATSNTLDVVSTPNVGVGFAVPFYHSKVFVSSVEVIGDYLAPSTEDSYSVNSGYSVGGKISLTQHAKNDLATKMEGDIFAKYLNQGTSITTQNNLEIGASLQFNFDVFSHDDNQ